MSTLFAKNGFSRPSLEQFFGVSLWDCDYSPHQNPWPLFPQDKESFFEKHRTQKKWVSFSRSLRVFPSLTWCLATVLLARFHYYNGCLERRTVDSSKIQTNFLRAI